MRLMEQKLFSKHLRFVLLAALCLGPLECAKAVNTPFDTGVCTAANPVRDCICDGGTQGQQTCQQDGRWSACQCGDAVDADPSGNVGADAGATGRTGDGGVDAAPFATGVDAGPITTGGVGGVDASDGSRDASNLEDSAVGASDAGNATGASDASNGSDASDAGSGVPPYGECLENDDCRGDNAVCYRAGASATVDSTTPGFCTVACDPDSPVCPEPANGTAQATCSSSSSRCILDCGSGDCPIGMVCDDFSVLSACNYPET